jgi:hypothetical protein
VEILIVVVILGILAAIVVPKFARAGDEPVYQVAKNFEHNLELGTMFATYTGTRVEAPDEFKYFVDSGYSTLDPTYRAGWAKIDQKIRRLLVDPAAYLMNDPNEITLTFKTGLVAVYKLNKGKVTATYTGPGAP